MKLLILMTSIFLFISCESPTEEEPNGFYFEGWFNEGANTSDLYNLIDSNYVLADQFDIWDEGTPEYFPVNWIYSSQAYTIGVNTNSDFGDSVHVLISLLDRNKNNCSENTIPLTFYKIAPERDGQFTYQSSTTTSIKKVFFSVEELPPYDTYIVLKVCDDIMYLKGELL